MTKNKDTKQGSTERDETIDGEKSTAQDQTPGTGNGDNMTEEEIPLTVEFAQLQVKYEELNNSYLRLHAEFDNFRKRTERQTRDLILRANEDLICELLPVLDNYCLALDSIESESVRKGMKMIYDQLIRVLESQGLAAIGSVGCNFDPSLHEAVAHAESAEHGDNIVVEEIRRGYMLGGKVIRPSMVKVNIKKEE